MFAQPPEEVDLADLLCDIHPWAERVRFTRAGGEAAAVAVRMLERPRTDHLWQFAATMAGTTGIRELDTLGERFTPWTSSFGLDPLGVPRELRDTAVTFRANNREEFQSIIDKYGDHLAAVVR